MRRTGLRLCSWFASPESEPCADYPCALWNNRIEPRLGSTEGVADGLRAHGKMLVRSYAKIELSNRAKTFRCIARPRVECVPFSFSLHCSDALHDHDARESGHWRCLQPSHKRRSQHTHAGAAHSTLRYAKYAWLYYTFHICFRRQNPIETDPARADQHDRAAV